MQKGHRAAWTGAIAVMALGAASSVGTILAMRGQICDLTRQLADRRPGPAQPRLSGASGDASARDAMRLREEAADLHRRAARSLAEAEKIRDQAAEIRSV